MASSSGNQLSGEKSPYLLQHASNPVRICRVDIGKKMDHHSFRDWNVLKRLFCTFYIRKVGTTTAINHAILLRVKKCFYGSFFA